MLDLLDVVQRVEEKPLAGFSWTGETEGDSSLTFTSNGFTCHITFYAAPMPKPFVHITADNPDSSYRKEIETETFGSTDEAAVSAFQGTPVFALLLFISDLLGTSWQEI